MTEVLKGPLGKTTYIGTRNELLPVKLVKK